MNTTLCSLAPAAPAVAAAAAAAPAAAAVAPRRHNKSNGKGGKKGKGGSLIPLKKGEIVSIFAPGRRPVFREFQGVSAIDPLDGVKYIASCTQDVRGDHKDLSEEWDSWEHGAPSAFSPYWEGMPLAAERYDFTESYLRIKF